MLKPCEGVVRANQLMPAANLCRVAVPQLLSCISLDNVVVEE